MTKTLIETVEIPKGSALRSPTLVMNKHWRPIDSKSAQEACCDVFAGKADILGSKALNYETFDFQGWLDLGVPEGEPRIVTTRGPMRAPEIIINQYKQLPSRKTRFSRVNLWRRDAYRCQYCGSRPPDDELTIDHVIPKHLWNDEWHVLGSKMPFRMTSFRNCVLACIKCNKRKDHRALQECGMRLQRYVMDKATGEFHMVPYNEPKVPPWNPTYNVRRKALPKSWHEWIANMVDELYWHTELVP